MMRRALMILLLASLQFQELVSRQVGRHDALRIGDQVPCAGRSAYGRFGAIYISKFFHVTLLHSKQYTRLISVDHQDVTRIAELVASCYGCSVRCRKGWFRNFCIPSNSFISSLTQTSLSSIDRIEDILQECRKFSRYHFV